MLDKKLINVANKIDADMLTEMLENNGIHSLQKTSGSGGYMQITTGMNLYGVDIYVEEEDYPQAKEIADSFFEKGTENIGGEENNGAAVNAGSEENTDIKAGIPNIYRIIAGIILVVVFVGILWSLL